MAIALTPDQLEHAADLITQADALIVAAGADTRKDDSGNLLTGVMSGIQFI